LQAENAYGIQDFKSIEYNFHYILTQTRISWAPGSSSCIQIVDVVSTAAAAGSVTSA